MHIMLSRMNFLEFDLNFIKQDPIYKQLRIVYSCLRRQDTFLNLQVFFLKWHVSYSKQPFSIISFIEGIHINLRYKQRIHVFI